ncbi:MULTISPECIES: hypothetical protein [Streptomyces]|nr:hypothetical protein [Streptomyces avermitilis]MYS96346.1 hypothetical protein [Streptomyces sp. SID5469]
MPHHVFGAARNAAPRAMIVADGFSCRTRITQGDTGRQAMHLAEALALGLNGPAPAGHPEKLAPRPSVRVCDARLTAAAALATAPAAATAGTYAVIRRLRL